MWSSFQGVDPMPTPSIAVLPFADQSADKGQHYFCDGLAAELIAGLSCGLLRAAPPSVFVASTRLRRRVGSWG
jgi:TolB-like protein